jgi:hypothetical protein
MYIPHLTARPSKSLLTIAIKVIYKFDGNAETSILYLSTYSLSHHETKSNILFTYNRVCLCIYHTSQPDLQNHCSPLPSKLFISLMAMLRLVSYISAPTPLHSMKQSATYSSHTRESAYVCIIPQISQCTFDISAQHCHQKVLMAMPRPLFYISVSTPPHTIRSSSPCFCCLILSVNIYITSQIQNFNASAHHCHQSYL